MDVGDADDLVMDLIVSPAVTSHSSAILGITLCSVGSISGARLVQLAESQQKIRSSLLQQMFEISTWGS